MPDQLFRQLWIAAILIRIVAILIGVRWRAPAQWLIWAATFEAFEVALFACDRFRLIGPRGCYVHVFLVEQCITPVLLGWFVWGYCRPKWDRIWLGMVASSITIEAFWMSRRYPDSPIEPAVWFAAWASLMLAVMLFARRTHVSMVLAGYLCLFALLMIDLPGDWLSLANVNRASEILEIVTFSAFTFVFAKHRRAA